MIRLDRERLREITGLQQRGAQVRWFKRHFGVELPCDQAGPILTEQAFEALVNKRCGIFAGAEGVQSARPRVHPRSR
ncbi:DUF4224 domain-containing protein [Chitiniphilus shinanonensis]|uniref:DUF4224 domain-containing protein n=1 Tax=Chitiniphilus shinanonensis TaxID=553088 RepID=UPI00333FB519